MKKLTLLTGGVYQPKVLVIQRLLQGPWWRRREICPRSTVHCGVNHLSANTRMVKSFALRLVELLFSSVGRCRGLQGNKGNERIKKRKRTPMHVLEMQPSRVYFLDTAGTPCFGSAAIQRVFFGPLFGTCFALGAALQRVFSGHTVNYFFLQYSNNYFWN